MSVIPIEPPITTLELAQHLRRMLDLAGARVAMEMMGRKP